ncbi:MAG: PTS sugar transporter subunit IIA [Planctomycetota bacterium]|nr:PTS sugar transporter subunit IIA [Planctomycetota bacterium]MDI6787011.1 PTS sugar transporter subunit IIA [Planctomycetota bacterium]
MKITDFIPKSSIIKKLNGTDKKAVIIELVETLKTTYKSEKIKVDEVVDMLMKREKIGSTGIGNSIAVPHAKIEGIKSVMGAFGRSPEGIDFNAIDGGLVHLVFLILAPVDDPESNLQALKRIARATQQQNFCNFLKEAKDSSEIFSLFREFDEVLN